MRRLGEMYAKGDGGPKDVKKAMEVVDCPRRRRATLLVAIPSGGPDVLDLDRRPDAWPRKKYAQGRHPRRQHRSRRGLVQRSPEAGSAARRPATPPTRSTSSPVSAAAAKGQPTSEVARARRPGQRCAAAREVATIQAAELRVIATNSSVSSCAVAPVSRDARYMHEQHEGGHHQGLDGRRPADGGCLGRGRGPSERGSPRSGRRAAARIGSQAGTIEAVNLA